MRKLVYYVGVSLDGRIAGPAGEVDFFPVGDDLLAWIREEFPETVPTHLRPHIGMAPDEPNRRFDVLVMGRATYEPALEIGVTNPYAHLRQYVVSSTLVAADCPDVHVVAGDPVPLVRGLKQEEGADIWLCGGGRLAGALLGEIDELVLKTYPVVAGRGINAFDGTFDPSAFTVTSRCQFDDGTQVTRFVRS
jgi:dihydrofolate reductase